MAPWSSKSKKNGAQISQAQSGVKQKILSAISESVSEVQYQYKSSCDSITSNDITNRLCTALEAVFVHGLKETFLGRLSSRFSDGGVSSPRMPEPSFWTFALVFSHKEVINQLDSLGQITTDIGRGRAWLRQALNDGLLVSYLGAMLADKVSLAVHYEKFAFLRDPDKRDLCLSYLTGLSVFTFSLSINVSTLNRWQTRPLVLAGAWRDSNVEVDLGADVAADMVEDVADDNTPDFVRTLAEPIRDSAGLGYMRRGLLNEDEALRLILQSTPVAFSPRTKSFLGFSENEIIDEAEEDNADNDNVEKSDQEHDELLLEEQIIEDESSFPYSIVGNVDSVEKKPDSPEPEEIMTISETEKMKDMRSLTVSPTLEWDNTDTETTPVVSPCLADEMREAMISNNEDDNEEEHVSVSRTQSPAPACKTPSSSRCMSPTSNCSSLSLCHCPPDSPRPECRMCGTRSPGQRPTLVLQVGVVSPAPHGDLISQQHDRQRRLAGMGFSETPGVRVTSLSLAQNIMMTRALDLICHESGLGSQDWRCQDCDKSIGALFGQPRLCQYTRKYYCEECHTNDMMIIPARLLYNWDATQYKVARSSQLFLKSVSNKPIINVNSFSPKLSKIAPVLDNAHRLRKQLIYLSAYLTACSKANQDGVKVSLAEIVWPREYLYNDTEMYSINDLAQLHSGELISTLSSAVRLCIGHVTTCLICSGRGFICEICRDKKPVYPFNLDTTSQCRDCHTVFHSSCSRELSLCPKCERLEARNLQWHVNNSKIMRELGPDDV